MNELTGEKLEQAIQRFNQKDGKWVVIYQSLHEFLEKECQSKESAFFLGMYNALGRGELAMDVQRAQYIVYDKETSTLYPASDAEGLMLALRQAEYSQEFMDVVEGRKQ